MQLGGLSGPRAGSVNGGRDRANSVALAALCLLLFLTFLDSKCQQLKAVHAGQDMREPPPGS